MTTPSPIHTSLTRLTQLALDEQVTGAASPQIDADLRADYGVSAVDLQQSAVAFDRSEQRTMRRVAIERTAREIGRRDAQAAVDRQLEAQGTLTAGTVQGFLDALDAATSRQAAAPEVVTAYQRGYTEALGTEYVRLNKPREHRMMRTVVDATRESGDLVGAHDLVIAADKMPANRDANLEQYLSVQMQRGEAGELLREMTQAALAQRVTELAQKNPKLPITALVQQARGQLRAESAREVGAQKAFQFAAWEPVSMRAMQDAAAQVRTEQAFVPPSMKAGSRPTGLKVG